MTSTAVREYVRAPNTAATLVKVPARTLTDEQLASFTALSDVTCTATTPRFIGVLHRRENEVVS